ncbi:MAG: hypothetical protein F6K06_06525 [Okeania sp. SIO1H4]|nr:hypothetical protein [Okeania hirsuta]NES75488.1 hypothetical protein [Okeania sp. SIO1H4]NES89051.1 hypothetical protein [Okeania sp. SIO2B9]
MTIYTGYNFLVLFIAEGRRKKKEGRRKKEKNYIVLILRLEHIQSFPSTATPVFESDIVSE